MGNNFKEVIMVSGAEKQMSLEKERAQLCEDFSKARPDLWDSEYSVVAAVFKDGIFTKKLKHLIAMAIALRAGCVNCILFHTLLAIEAGANKDEILETCGVVISMDGTPGIGETLRVCRILQEKGMW
jgi:AhpD family alkylhydroperoxidase